MKLSLLRYLLPFVFSLEATAQIKMPITDLPSVTTFSASGVEVLNPARGIYRFRPLSAMSDFGSVRPSGASLIYAELDLALFKGGKISEERLSDIEQAFLNIEKAGIKAIIRPVYAHAIGEDDAPLAIIQQHLRQLAPLFNKYAHLIYAFQAGCLGAWGEWHSSTQIADTSEARNEVIDSLLELLPAKKQVHLRRPSFKIEYAKSRSSGLSRLGHHNDCILSNATDSGTYPADSVQEHRRYMKDDSKESSVGGETCQVSPNHSTCSKAVELFRYIGMSYLNADYHPDVIEGFRSGRCWQQIVNYLGYRIEPVSLSLTGDSGMLIGEFTIKNTGWAPPYERYPFIVRLRQGGTAIVEKEISSLDIRSLTPGSAKTIHFQFPLPEAARDTELVFALPDEHPVLRKNGDYAIRLASSGMRWDALTGENSITIAPSIHSVK